MDVYFTPFFLNEVEYKKYIKIQEFFSWFLQSRIIF